MNTLLFSLNTNHLKQIRQQSSNANSSRERQNLQPHQSSTYQKYHNFLNMQNQLMKEQVRSPSQLQSDRQYISGIQNIPPTQFLKREDKENPNRIKQSQNKYIKQLLSELTEIYTNSKNLKLATNQKIAQLEQQIKTEQAKNAKLSQALYNKFEQSSQKCQNYIKLLHVELEEEKQNCSNKLKTMLQEIGNKDKQIQYLQRHQKECREKISQITRMLRMQQQKYNQKHRQWKGMGQVVMNYQSVMAQQQQQCRRLQALTHNLNTKMEELQHQTKILKDIEQQNLQQISIQNTQNIKLKNCNISMQNEIKSKNQTIKSQQKQFQTQLQSHKTIAMTQILKIRQKYSKRDKIFKKIIQAKLKEIKHQNTKMKEFLLKEVFNFCHAIKMQMTLTGLKSHLQ